MASSAVPAPVHNLALGRAGGPILVIGAERIGMCSVWVARSDQPIDDLGYLPDLTLNSLLDLHRALAL